MQKGSIILLEDVYPQSCDSSHEVSFPAARVGGCVRHGWRGTISQLCLWDLLSLILPLPMLCWGQGFLWSVQCWFKRPLCPRLVGWDCRRAGAHSTSTKPWTWVNRAYGPQPGQVACPILERLWTRQILTLGYKGHFQFSLQLRLLGRTGVPFSWIT